MNRRTVLVFVLICAASSCVFAQPDQDIFVELIKASKAAEESARDRSVRKIMKTDDLEKGKIVKSVTQIYEYLPSGSHRFLTTEKTGKKETSYELVYLRGVIYSRTNSEPWIKGNYPKGSKTEDESIIGFRVYSTKHTEELTFLDGKAARKFCSFEIVKRSDASESEGLSFGNLIVWFDNKSGLRLKTESTRGLLEPHVEKTRSVTTYEYDPNIKIEAPIAETEWRCNSVIIKYYELD